MGELAEAGTVPEMARVYSVGGNALARMMHWGALIVAIMGGLSGISATITGGLDGALFAVVAFVFAAGCLAVRGAYNVEPVWASPEGLWVLRAGQQHVVPWARVGRPQPLLGVDGSIVVVVITVEGERRPIRFVARTRHREVIERERERKLRAAPRVASAA